MAAKARNRIGEYLTWLKMLGQNFLSVLPIVAVVTILYFVGIVENFGIQAYVAFLICAFAIGIGLTLFTAGAEQSMSRIGKIIGETLFKKRKLILVLLMTFLIGFLVTIAEPDLKMLARQVGWDELVLILSVGVGVGLFVVFGVLRIIFNKGLNVMFLCFYGIVFALAGLVNPKFLPLAFDSGGVTTGPVTVPFILAFGAGLAASKANRDGGGEDSFGLTALASVGPIITVMALSLFMNVDELSYSWADNQSPLFNITSWNDFLPAFLSIVGHEVLGELKGVAIAIAPLAGFFLLYNFIFVRLPWKQLVKILIGLVYAYIGLVIFMTSVGTGFLPIAQLVGYSFGNSDKWFGLAVAIGALFGIFGVLAEPAVHVLVHQIEVVSEGTIKSRTVLLMMAISIGGGVALAIIRGKLGFSVLYFTVPGYILALGLSFLVPKIYTSIAFDSGGVASGPMASTFVMPYCIGFACAAGGEDTVFQNAFGSVAMIALMPLIVIQLMGLMAETKRKILYAQARKAFLEEDDEQMIHFAEAR